ncbi:MAG: hypothetical protein HYX93_04055 [Chloroflexi bacterium]|nr:hypothetical protein [Chloroflexota bacterium]
MASGLTFVINPDAQAASVDLFFKALENIRRLLRDVDYAIHRESGTRRWVISEMHSSAPTLTVNPLLGDRETIDAVAMGIRSVTIGQADHPPQYFTEQALNDLAQMRRLFKGRDRARSIGVLVDSEPTATIGEGIDDQTKRILVAGYWNLGSIEGRLDAINVHGTPTFTVWDRVSRAPVRCSFPNDPEWKERVKHLLERRVFVKGKIRYFSNGVPRSIGAIEGIQDATPDPNLPKAGFGSIPDREAARDPVQFLRGIRGLEKE